jgi:hypothetical protein
MTAPRPTVFVTVAAALLILSACSSAPPASVNPNPNGAPQPASDAPAAAQTGTMKPGNPLIDVPSLNGDTAKSTVHNNTVSGVCGNLGDYGQACKFVGRDLSDDTQGFSYMEIACGSAISSVSTRIGGNAGAKTRVTDVPNGVYTVDSGTKGISSEAELVWDAPTPFLVGSDVDGSKSCVITFGLNFTGTGSVGTADLKEMAITIAKDVETNAKTWTRG